MRDGFVRAALFVDEHLVAGAGAARAHHLDNRGAGRADSRGDVRLEAAGGLAQQQAVDAFGEEHPQVQRLLRAIVVAAGEQQRVACGMRAILDAANHLGPERIGDVGGDHAERSRLLCREAPCQQVRLVFQLANRARDAVLQAGTHIGAGVDDGRDRRQRDLRLAGHVVDGRHGAQSSRSHRRPAKRFARRLDTQA